MKRLILISIFLATALLFCSKDDEGPREPHDSVAVPDAESPIEPELMAAIAERIFTEGYGLRIDEDDARSAEDFRSLWWGTHLDPLDVIWRLDNVELEAPTRSGSSRRRVTIDRIAVGSALLEPFPFKSHPQVALSGLSITKLNPAGGTREEERVVMDGLFWQPEEDFRRPLDPRHNCVSKAELAGLISRALAEELNLDFDEVLSKLNPLAESAWITAILVPVGLSARQQVLTSELYWDLQSPLIARNADLPWSSAELLVYSGHATTVLREKDEDSSAISGMVTRFKLTGGNREDFFAPGLGEATTLQLIEFVEWERSGDAPRTLDEILESGHLEPVDYGIPVPLKETGRNQ